LSYGYNFAKLKDFESAIEKGEMDSFFEVLIYLFAKKLIEQLKMNPNRSYITVEDESNFLKGSWRLSEQLSKSPHLKHKFHVSYDEFTDNNELNRILKFVSRMLLFATSNSGNKLLLHHILLIYAEIDDILKPDAIELDKVKFTRINQEYKPIFELARLFLNKLSTHTLDSKISTFTFMFDMNFLFEQFIAGFIRQYELHPPEYKMETQKCSESLLKEVQNERIVKHFSLKPDILFKDKDANNVECIIDTKYKQLDEKVKSLGVSQSDAYQMYAYSQIYNCPRVILLYPQHLNKEAGSKNFTFYNSIQRLDIRTVNICRDLEKDKGKLVEDIREILINKIGEK
jgi:5-methylcytosine-specific restriction enzyme subunit McrC